MRADGFSNSSATPCAGEQLRASRRRVGLPRDGARRGSPASSAGVEVVDLEEPARAHDARLRSTSARIATAASISSSVTSSDGANRSAVGVTALTTSPASRHALRDGLGVDARRRARPRSAGRRRARRRRRATVEQRLGEHARRPAAARAGTSTSRPSRRAPSSAARAASGWPPNVVAWSPGRNAAATSARAQHAPIGTPLPSALAIVTMSGRDAGVLERRTTGRCGRARSAPRRRSAAPRARRTARARPRGTRAATGCTPPSPCTASSITAHTRSSIAAASASRSANATWRKPVGQRLERLLLLRLAGGGERGERAAVERAVRREHVEALGPAVAPGRSGGRA